MKSCTAVGGNRLVSRVHDRVRQDGESMLSTVILERLDNRKSIHPVICTATGIPKVYFWGPA